MVTMTTDTQDPGEESKLVTKATDDHVTMTTTEPVIKVTDEEVTMTTTEPITMATIDPDALETTDLVTKDATSAPVTTVPSAPVPLAPVAPPDGGYGWVIVACSLFVSMIYGSNWVLFSVYLTDFSEAFQKSQATISVIGSIDAAFSSVAALPAGAFVTLYGCRAVCIAGILVCAVGTLLSAFTTSFIGLVITFGVIKGCGAGMIYVPASTLVQQYFSTKRPLAAGIASCGLSLGAMVFGPIHRLLISTYGWRGALLLTSALYAQILVCAALMRPLRSHRITPPSQIINSAPTYLIRMESQARRIASHLRRGLSPAVFRDRRFPLFLLMKTLGMFGMLAMYKFSVGRAVSYGVDKLHAAFLVTALGLTSTLGRYLGGLVGSQSCVNRLLVYSVSLASDGVATMVSVLPRQHVSGHLVCHLVYGCFLGMSEGLLPTIAVDLFGVQRLPTTLGWQMLFIGVLSLIYMPIFGESKNNKPHIGLICDVTRSYDAAYIVGGVVTVLGGSLGIAIYRMGRQRHGERDMEQHEM